METEKEKSEEPVVMSEIVHTQETGEAPPLKEPSPYQSAQKRAQKELENSPYDPRNRIPPDAYYPGALKTQKEPGQWKEEFAEDEKGKQEEKEKGKARPAFVNVGFPEARKAGFK